MFFFLEKVGISVAVIDGQNACHVFCLLRCSAVQFIEFLWVLSNQCNLWSFWAPLVWISHIYLYIEYIYIFTNTPSIALPDTFYHVGSNIDLDIRHKFYMHWGYPPPASSELIICSLLWRAPYNPYKPSLSTVSGPGIPPIYAYVNASNMKILVLPSWYRRPAHGVHLHGWRRWRAFMVKAWKIGHRGEGEGWYMI